MARILIVEDEQIPRAVLSKVLSRDGHEVRAAASAEEAVAAGILFKPEVVILDWLLTDTGNGLQVAEQLREADPGVQLLFFTGLPAHRLQGETQHLRPCRFLEKPCDFEVLREAIRETLDGVPAAPGNWGLD